MSDLEELRKRKEELLLAREIAKLERDKRLEEGAKKLSWWWVAPLSLFSIVIFALAIGHVTQDGTAAVAVALCLVALVPLGMKLWKQ